MKTTPAKTKTQSNRIKTDVLASLLLIALGVIFFADVLFTSKNFYYRDILNFHFPLHKILIDSYSGGELPLWNPFVYLGQPMLANPNYLAFYPSNLLHLLIPFNYAFKLHFLLHPILGGLGTYFLLRRLDLKPFSALAGAVSYQFSGTVLAFLNLYNLVPATALIPWIGWAFQGALNGHRVRRVLLLGFLAALLILVFEPILLQCCAFLILALLIFYLSDKKDWKQQLKIPAFVILWAVLFAFGIAAIQMVPTFELLPLSARGSGLQESMALKWSMHPMDLLNTIIPNFYGFFFTLGSATSWGENYHEFREPYLVSFFIGSFTLLLGALAFFSARKRLRSILFAFSAITLILALGKFGLLYAFLFQHLPLFNLGRYPSKYFLITTLFICMLAALGLETAVEKVAQKERRGMQRILTAGLITGFVILCFGLVWIWNVQWLESLIRDATPSSAAAAKDFHAIAAGLARSMASTGAFLILGALIILKWPRLKNYGKLIELVVLLIVVIELAAPNMGLAPYISDADVEYVPDLARQSVPANSNQLFRAVTPNYIATLPEHMTLKAPNRSVAWQVLYNKRSGLSFDGIKNGVQYSLFDPVDNLNSRESDTLMRRSSNLSQSDKLMLLANLNTSLVPAVGALPEPDLTELGTIDTHSDLDFRLYRINNILPRAYFATETISVSSQEEALNRLIESKSLLSNKVILESQQKDPAVTSSIDSASVNISRYENSRVVCQVRTDTPGHVVLLDSWYPGWKAYVDGREVEVQRANYAFRAVEVARGTHKLEFIFAPKSFYAGAGITFLTMLIGLTIAAFFILKRK
ncbi:MAG: YfhO family protein [Acidobacteria bacterium]|nr:YfhO family protein [Acidobacteriota bacterium]